MLVDGVRRVLREIIARDGSIRVATLFGSAQAGALRPDSDIDVAVAASDVLSSDRRAALISAIADRFGRPVDLVDLRVATGAILREALAGGELIYCDDRAIYAELIRRLLYDQADMMPYRDRILRERRRAWIGR